MQEKNKSTQLSSHQFVLLVFISTIALKMLMLPALIFVDFGRDSYIVFLIYVALEIVALVCLILTHKISNGKSIFKITEAVFGKVGNIIARIIFGLFAAFYFAKLLLFLGETNLFFSSGGIYENFNFNIMIIPLLIVIGILAVSARGVGRTGEIFAPFLLLGVLILCILIAIKCDFSDILPFGIDLSKVSKDNFAFHILRLAMWFGDISVLFVFCGNMSVKEAFKREKEQENSKLVQSIAENGKAKNTEIQNKEISNKVDISNDMSKTEDKEQVKNTKANSTKNQSKMESKKSTSPLKNKSTTSTMENNQSTKTRKKKSTTSTQSKIKANISLKQKGQTEFAQDNNFFDQEESNKKIQKTQQENEKRKEKEKGRGFPMTCAWFVLGTLAIICIIIVFSATYNGLEGIIEYGQTVAGITQSYVGNIGRVDLFVFAVLTLAIFLLMGIYFSALVRCVSYVTCVKKYKYVTVPLLVLLYIISIFCLHEKARLLNFARYIYIPALIMQFLFPLFFFITAFLTKDKKEEEGEKNDD